VSNQYSADMKTAEVFKEIERRLNEQPEPIQGMETVYQFDLTGEDGGVYQLHLSGGTAKVQEGEGTPADCTIQMDAKDFKEMLLGNLNATSAFMTGKLKVKGDLGRAMKLQSLLGKYEV
jgi:putative sterol carrier protein